MAGRWRRFVVRPLFWLAALLAAVALGLYLLVGSTFARTRVSDLLAARAGEALGRRVTIERVDFSLVPLWLELEGVTIAGDRPGAPDFARIERAELDADWHGVRKPVLELSRLAVYGLELALEFRDDGSSNLPRPPRRAGGAAPRVELKVGGVYVERGTVRLEETTAPFSLAAETVDVRATALAGGALDGAVNAARVRMTLPRAAPFDAALAARVRLEGERLEIVRARVSAPDLAAVVTGDVRLRAPTAVTIQGTVESRGELLDRLGYLRGEISGPIRYDGNFTWRPKVWGVAGRVASPALTIVGFELSELAGRVEGGARALALELESARWAEGELDGRFDVGLARPYPALLDVDVRAAAVARVLAQFDVPVAGVRGVASGPVRYQFDLLAATRGQGGGELEIGPGAGDPADVGGRVALAFAGGVLELPAIAWHAGAQEVTGSGRVVLVGGGGRFDLEVKSAELGGLVRMLPFLDPNELWAPLAGTAQAKVGLDLAPGTFRAEVDLEGGGVESAGARAERVTARFVVTERALDFERLELVRPGARLALDGTLGLAADGPPLALRLAATDWPLDEARPWLPFALPLEGKVTGRLALAGSLEKLSGRAELSVPEAKLPGLDARRLQASFDWDPRELRLHAARIELDAGVATVDGTVDLAGERFALRLDAPALALDRPPFAPEGGGPLSGRLALTARLGGTFARPELELAGEPTDLVLNGEPLALEGASRVAASWRDGVLDAELALSGVGRLTGGGMLEMGREAGRDATLAFRFESARLDRLVMIATGTQVSELEGGLVVALAVELPADAPPRLAIEVPQAEFRWRGHAIRSLEPIRARFDGETLTIDSVYLGIADGTDELFVAGQIVLEDDPRLDLHLQADVGAALLRPLLGDPDLGGQIALLADLGGTATAPAWRGQGEWSDGRYVPPTLPHVFDQARALVLLYPNAVVLDRLAGRFGGGDIDANGRVELDGGAPSSYRFELRARRVALRWPPGWQTRGDADLALASTAAGRQITGVARFDRLYYFQDIDLSATELLERLLARSRVVLPETDEFLAATTLNVALFADESVRVRNNVADLQASASLTLRGSLARPVVFGEVATLPGGHVTYAGNRYEVERGLLTFADSTRIDPQLDIVARTKVDEYDVTFQLGGALSRPLATFSSDPPLADLEILALLTTGAPPDSALLSDREPGAEAHGAVGAESLLYGQAASLVGARVGKLFGFDQVRVQPLSSGDTVSAARVTVGKRLSRRLFVTYSIDPTSTAQEILQAEYRLSERLVLVLTQNGNESFAVDARWESRF